MCCCTRHSISRRAQPLHPLADADPTWTTGSWVCDDRISEDRRISFVGTRVFSNRTTSRRGWRTSPAWRIGHLGRRGAPSPQGCPAREFRVDEEQLCFCIFACRPCARASFKNLTRDEQIPHCSKHFE